MAVTDRIELSAKTKNLRILNICGVIYLVIWLFPVLSGDAFTGEHIKALLMGAIFWSLLGKLWSQDAGLFIEWRADQVEFKTHNGSGLIDIRMLKNIDIGLDEIRAYLEKDKVQVIDIARFTDYDTRMRIKAHFSQLQKELKAD